MHEEVWYANNEIFLPFIKSSLFLALCQFFAFRRVVVDFRKYHITHKSQEELKKISSGS